MASEDSALYRYYKGPALLLPNVTDTAIDAVKRFQYKDDDILIASYPKSGTHWINEIVQLMIHDGDPQKLEYRHRRVCLEILDTIDFSKTDQMKPTVELVETDPSPRVLTTHLTPDYFSEETWEKRIPIIYILRDPRDACLSFYRFLRGFFVREGQHFLKEKTFEQFRSDFIEGKVQFSGWCAHALSYENCWKKGENVLFISYEDMKKDLPPVIKAVAKHIGRHISDEVVEKIVVNSTIEAMRKNYKDSQDKKDKSQTDLSRFLKTGTSGQWKMGQSEGEWSKLNEVFKEKVKNSEFAKKYFKY